jgi:hypothetical protein
MRSGQDLRYTILAAQRERALQPLAEAAGPHTCTGRGDDGAEREPFTIGEIGMLLVCDGYRPSRLVNNMVFAGLVALRALGGGPPSRKALRQLSQRGRTSWVLCSERGMTRKMVPPR